MKSKIEVNPDHIRNLPFCFIIGRPRSGTTLIRTLFDAHPNVCIPLETIVIPVLHPKYGQIKNWSKKKIYEFYKDTMSLQFFDNWPSDKEKLKNDLLKFEGNYNYTDLIKAFYLNYISFYEKKEIKMVMDKTPNNAIHLPFLMKLFPNAKFIHVIRNPHEHILSLQKVDFGSNNTLVISSNWKKVNLKIEKFKLKEPNRFRTVIFEDFLKQPETYVRDWCDFFSIEYSDSMLRFHELKEEINNYYTSDLIDKYHKSLLKPIRPSAGDGWKTKMNKKDIMITDYVAGKLADKYGYERMFSHFPVFWKFKNVPKIIYIDILMRLYYKMKRKFVFFLKGIYYRIFNG